MRILVPLLGCVALVAVSGAAHYALKGQPGYVVLCLGGAVNAAVAAGAIYAHGRSS